MWLDIDSSLQTNDSKYSTVFVTRLWPESTKSWLWLETILDDSDSKGLWLWLDSDSTKMTRAHHWLQPRRLSASLAGLNSSLALSLGKLGLDHRVAMLCKEYSQWWSLETWSRSWGVCRNPYFGVSVSVSNVSGVVSVWVSKDFRFGLGLELLVSRLCMSYFFMKSCKKQLLKNEFIK